MCIMEHAVTQDRKSTNVSHKSTFQFRMMYYKMYDVDNFI